MLELNNKSMKQHHFLLLIILALNPITARCQIIDTLVNNGGYHLHFSIIPGKGMPVLFETGYGNSVSIWNTIPQTIADITGAPVITYDRQGFGKSTVDPERKGIEDEIRGLETALAKLGYTNEIMLVSHSQGGFYNTLFTNRNPGRVKGIVFIDASHASMFTDEILGKMNLSPADREMVNTMKNQPPLPESLLVIDIISEANTLTNKIWKSSHDAFVSESPNRKGILAYKTSHYIFLDNDRLVKDAIVSLYADIQKPADKTKILEKAYAYELTAANNDYRQRIEYQYSENDLVEWAKSLLQNNNAANAIEILKLNVSLNPGSVAACDALAELCLKTGYPDLASVNYKRSLELKPANKNAQLIIDQIGRIIEIPDPVRTSYIGEYELNGVPMSITKEGDELIVRFNNTQSVAYFTSYTDFFIAEYRDEFKFFKDPDGNILGINLFAGMKALKVNAP